MKNYFSIVELLLVIVIALIVSSHLKAATCVAGLTAVSWIMRILFEHYHSDSAMSANYPDESENSGV